MTRVSANSPPPFERPSVRGVEGPPAPTPLAVSRPEADRLTLSAAAGELSEAEAGWARAGFLPPNFAELKRLARTEGREVAIARFREGRQGPFSAGYGDPEVMAEGARRLAENPELARLARFLRPGDIVLQSRGDGNTVEAVTQGPFVHALVCTASGPPAEFIEAMGISGSVSAQDGNTVRRITLSEIAEPATMVRVLRPTEGMASQAAARVVQDALRFATSKLGKPYDYAFTDDDGEGRRHEAYYCSELAYQAYASPEGAAMTVGLSKSPRRDGVMVALEAILEALEPRDKAALLDRSIKLFNAEPRPTSAQLADFLVDEALPQCRLTEGLAPTAERRASLKQTLVELLEGRAFAKTTTAVDALRQAEQAGELEGVSGSLRRQRLRSALAVAAASEGWGATRASGLEGGATARSGAVVVRALLPHLETLTEYLAGADSVAARQATRILDGMEGLQRHLASVPGAQDWSERLPTRAGPLVRLEFVSPTDLAEAYLPAYDFNVRPDRPVAPPWVPGQENR